jgi:N utilization substance protein A
MNVEELVESFSDFKELKDINRINLMSIMEDVLRRLLIKKYGEDEKFDIIVNVDKGDVEIWRNREIVHDGEKEFDSQLEISEALKIEDDFEIGEEYSEQISLEKLDRRSILFFKQNLISQVKDFQKDGIYRKYKDKVGDLISAEVYQIWRNECLLLDNDGNELRLPKENQIPGDFYKKGEMINAIVEKVDYSTNTPKVILSRVTPIIVEKLMEMDIPEILDGLITIKKVVRHPGLKSKVLVESYDTRVDPVGSCVGANGSRIFNISKELNESIDVIGHTENKQLLLQRSFKPAKIRECNINDDANTIDLYFDPSDIGIAIGKGGSNLRLTNDLIGYNINIFSTETDDEDVELVEFKDEIDQWIIDELRKVGYDTAKSVINERIEELEKRTDLERNTIDHILTILKSEFN